jgi:hypothetical protein
MMGHKDGESPADLGETSQTRVKKIRFRKSGTSRQGECVFLGKLHDCVCSIVLDRRWEI